MHVTRMMVYLGQDGLHRERLKNYEFWLNCITIGCFKEGVWNDNPGLRTSDRNLCPAVINQRMVLRPINLLKEKPGSQLPDRIWGKNKVTLNSYDRKTIMILMATAET